MQLIRSKFEASCSTAEPLNFFTGRRIGADCRRVKHVLDKLKRVYKPKQGDTFVNFAHYREG